MIQQITYKESAINMAFQILSSVINYTEEDAKFFVCEYISKFGEIDDDLKYKEFIIFVSQLATVLPATPEGKK